jgi:uncharacterized protein involved in outer membrane biogenesis
MRRSAGHLLAASGLHLAVPYSTLWKLWRGNDTPPRIASLQVEQIEATLRREADGRANWLLPASASRAPSAPARLPVFDELVIANGHLVYDDALRKTFLDARVRTHEAAQGGGEGLQIDGEGRHDGQPFSIHASSSGVLPLVARHATTAVPLTVRLAAGRSRFTFDGRATDLLGLQALDGAVGLSGPSLARVGDVLGLTLPTTEPFDLKGQLGKSGALWTLKNIALAVGDSRLGGTFSYDRSPAVPPAARRADRRALRAGRPAAGLRCTAPRQRQSGAAAGRVLPQREFDIPSLRQMDADVKVQLQRAELGTLFRAPLAPLQGDLSLRAGVLKLANAVARTAGGELRGTMALDSVQAPPRWNADMRWAGIELSQWLSPRNPRDPPGQDDRTARQLRERAARRPRDDGRARQVDCAADRILVGHGAGVGARRNGLAPGHRGRRHRPVRVARAADPRRRAAAAVLRGPEGEARRRHPRARSRAARYRDSTVYVTGSASLADEKLDLELVTRPKDKSPITLRSPLHVEGTFAAPKLRLDTRQLATKAGLAAVLAAVHPLASLVALFDPGDKAHAGGCERALQQLRDANGPQGARDAKAPVAPVKG